MPLPDTAPGGCLTDVAGIAVGHAQRWGRGWRTGTTVALLPPSAVVGVDVRGGGPGTRETDLLHPQATLSTAHAICLTGGSAYGLAAADGVMAFLEERRVGFPVGTTAAEVVPLVPAAVIFDLGRGGSFANRPDAGFGHRAAAAARRRPVANGAVGAGTGARTRGLQGGVGTASQVLDGGVVVAALAVVNAAGSVLDPSTGMPWEPGDDRLRRPTATDRAALREVMDAAVPSLNTTIGIVATTAALSKAEAGKFAAVAHDGLARAVRPVHSLFDGDTIFGVATCRDPLGGTDEPPRARTTRLNAVLEAGAACFARACTNAVVRAQARGGDPAYLDLCGSAGARRV
ncbi:MAG: P1 family peptidase [Ilumatobacteraceae bacterium]|nr:P1 family peptidase [Ilumatobacter sp.]MCB0985709.1 P1 family peptidase [Ilumatobacter sp.]